MSRIRTLDFLPSIFQTPTNSEFLGATLDQLVNPPVSKTLQGYVGSKLGYGINAKDYYVTEPTKERTDYQLEPGVVFLKDQETVAKDFISYPGIINSLKVQGAEVDNNNNLFTSQTYSFDPFCSFDNIINFNQYYWLPEGPPSVRVAASAVYSTNNYIVTYTPGGYNIRIQGSSSSANNPTLTLLRGGVYNFLVDQDTQFWIQGEPGVTGYSASQTNLYVRDIYGVDNNGASTGVVTFTVPPADAQNDDILPGANPINVVCTIPFDDLYGAKANDFTIDGITVYNGLTVMFYNTGIVNEYGYISNLYGETNYEVNDDTLIAPLTINVTATDNTGNITVSNTANLTVGNSITFSGTGFGKIEPYQVNTPAIIYAPNMAVGKKYCINTIGGTDWISAGVIADAVVNAQISGTNLIIDSVISGHIGIGCRVTGTGVTAGTYITAYNQTASYINGKPTYTINNSQTLSVRTISIYDVSIGKVFTCAAIPFSISNDGTVVPYTPSIYYISSINNTNNTIKISETIDGPVFVTTTATGSLTANINQGLYEEGYYTKVNENFYQIQYVGDPLDPIIKLVACGSIPVNQNIIPQYGVQYNNLKFAKRPAISEEIQLLPYISAPLTTLYYQDGTNPNNVGVIRIIESNINNTINVETDILGQTNYTSLNGVTFTNGLKVTFDGDVIPVSYLQGEYYVEGVGTTAEDGGGIQLIPVESLTVVEPFTVAEYYPYGMLPYDVTVYDLGLNVPVNPEYITIARNSINRNAWARSNRWFHIQVIEATATYNDNPEIVNLYATAENKAKRPIIQFYPNLKLYNSGSLGRDIVDFIDYRTTDPFYYVENQQSYFPDVESYTDYTGTIYTNTVVGLNEILENQWYRIVDFGNTNPETWIYLGAEVIGNGQLFEVGTEYAVTDTGFGTNWTIICGIPRPPVGYIFTALTSGFGAGTGQAVKTLFKAVNTGIVQSPNIVAGLNYTISYIGKTQWQNIGWIPNVDGHGSKPAVGDTFTATGPGVGDGIAIQGDGSVRNMSIVTLDISASEVTGTLKVGQWINDVILGQPSRLPLGTRILAISGNIVTVYYTRPAIVMGHTYNPLVEDSGASFVASTEDNQDLIFFPGATVIFANDEVDDQYHNKVYRVNFNRTGSTTYPVITLEEVYDGTILEDDLIPIRRGFNYKGLSFWYDGFSYLQAQQKQVVNQAPLFDVFDSDGISYGNPEYYNSTTFEGSKLFNYKIGTSISDSILGFPISYSSFSNVNDIRFEVSLYTDQFKYVKNGNSVTSYIYDGYVYNYTSRFEYNRMLGWQTSIAPSQQYQVFEFSYYANVPPVTLATDEVIPYTVLCDIPQLPQTETIWPSLQVYNNNTLLTIDTDYTVVNTDTSTTVTVNLTEDVDTVIQVLLLSDEVSENAYYTIPVNLSNNPLNTNPESMDLGDLRGQYTSIYTNNSNLAGVMFGSNNYRDLGNLVPYGNRIIQNSASLVLPGAFLRNPDTNLFDSLLFNSREYIKYKTLLVDTINRIAYNQKYDPATLLDQALDEITSVKSQEQPFFWSDMLPNKSAYITNIYTFFNDQDTSIFPLSKVYDFTSANYNGVLVYLQRKITGVLVTKQFVTGVDYTISTDSPSLTITTDLLNGDKIIVKEYNNTYGSYVPNTPTKLGLYPSYLPQVVYDESYQTPTWFIQGHDGSYTKMYGDYNEVLGMCIDFRDQILLEFEQRIYNNLKLSNILPITPQEVIPGYFRKTPLSYEQFNEIYSTNFLDWVGQNRLNYKAQVYQVGNTWTYNYRGSTFKIGSETGNAQDVNTVLQGNWRGIYTYLYDTSTPDTTPWEMIGYTTKPSWWESQYGSAPYTSDNLILWQDMENGYDYNNGNPIEREIFKRPGLSKILPVDSNGDLREPLNCVIANFNPLSWQRSWIVGDDAPVEFSYRKSSTYPFDLMKLQALIKPALFYNLAVDLDNYKYNIEFNQFLFNERSHLVPNEIQIYGNGTAKTSYINWIVDYQKQYGIDATTKIESLLSNLDVRLVNRLAGFSDKVMLKFFVEKGSPSSPNPSLLIPDESYQVLLYNNVPSDKIIFSGVIVQKTDDGYAVYGNNQASAYFKILNPITTGAKINIAVQDVTVTVPTTYGPNIIYVPYGTVYYTEQEVAQFLLAYGRYLESQGMKFETQVQGTPINWTSMVQEYLYWMQSGWSIGSVVTLNPAAETLSIDKESLIVQPLTMSGSNFILNNNMYPIQNKDLNIFRDGTVFEVKPLNQGDALSYGQFDLSNIEHGIVFDNTTLFGDVIYNLQTGLKQNRIYVRGTKSAEWNGTMFASGFIYNQDNIENWTSGVKYPKGGIVKYKNKYFTAIVPVQPNSKFVATEWKETDYDQIQKGLLPNSSTRSVESALYYNINKANLEEDADLLSFSLIGYRPREYMASADLTDITQVNVYKNLIKDKGTLNALKAFKNAQLPQGGIDYDVYENWAILQGEYGGVLNNNFVQLRLQEKLLTGNPSIVGLTNGNAVEGAQQLIALNSVYNYGRAITTPDILPLRQEIVDALFPDAGYVNVNDVKMMAYTYANLPTAVDKNGTIQTIDKVYVNDYIWLANYKSTWQILTPTSIGQVLKVSANLNNTSTVTFEENHNLSQYDIFAIINFDVSVNGYYIVTNVVNQTEVLINLVLPNQTRSITGQGIGLKFTSHHVSQPSDIQNLSLLNNEFVSNTVWVDESSKGDWAVYRKSINYKYGTEINRVTGVISQNTINFGAAVAYSPLSHYIISDPKIGRIYRYRYNILRQEYLQEQQISHNISFGTTIAHEQNIYVISQPTRTPSIYLYAINNLINNTNMILYQTILASDIDTTITNFGSSVAISGDTNWLFISDYNDAGHNSVHVFRKGNQIINVDSSTVLLTDATYQILEPGTLNWTEISNKIIAGDKDVYFTYNGHAITGIGTAIRCDYKYQTTISSESTSYDKFGYSLSTNYDGTILFVGTPNQDYSIDIENWGKTYVYNRLVQNIIMDTVYNPATPVEYTLVWTPDTPLITVTKNGMPVQGEYYIVGNVLTYTGYYTTGDILTISGNDLVNVQILDTEQTPRIGVGFGTSVDNNTHATEVIVGAPFALDSNNNEGAAYRFTNAGAKFGVISGVSNVDVTTERTILLNGYIVTIPAGNATAVANAINNAKIINVQAIASNGKLVISVINQDLALAEQKLLLSVTDSITLLELGISIYSQTQVIQCPHKVGPTQFGTVVKFNEYDSVAISAPVGTRVLQTLFDFTDDENLDNDTIFDNNSTQFIDNYTHAGAVYTFDYLANYNESLSNLGAFTYAQSVNAINEYYGALPRYGSAIDWSGNTIIIGAPNYRPDDIDGQAIIYVSTTGVKDWNIYRKTGEVVDIDAIQNIKLFSAETNNTLESLDYIDPLQNKLFGSVRENIDIISSVDPANYNKQYSTNNHGIIWGEEQIGMIWLNTSNMRYINYHQEDNSYNSKYWATLFPGSDVAVYSWIGSNVPPSLYVGPGTAIDTFNFVTRTTLNSSNVVTLVYYFWVRNSSVIFTKRGKTLADTNLESYINNPLQSGISYLAPLSSNAVALYNCKTYINANDTVLNLGYGNGNESNPYHEEYSLIRENYADDFLPGLPYSSAGNVPISLYDRLLDSLSGVDEQGAVVPDPFLPKAVQSGILARPRQSFFYNRYLALKNYIQYVNEIMTLYPITEIRPLAINGFLSESGAYYDTPLYWELVNWWASGYNNNTKSSIQVQQYSDLSALGEYAAEGTIVTVLQGQNLNGDTETYRYDGDSVWTRIGLANGTVQFSEYLYDYAAAGYGYDGTFYDTDAFDSYPSEETRWIIRALTEQIFTDDLLIYRNKSLILLFEYVQEETVESQNYLPWLKKTSLVDISHKIRELKPIQNYRSDNQEFLSGYVNEAKPYHVVIKEFLFDYTGNDVYPGTITDFDLPAQYNSTIDKFVSPQLTYRDPINSYEYGYDSDIWQDQDYSEWFSNYGVSVGEYRGNEVIGKLDYPIAKLMSYMNTTTTYFVVDNAAGLPTNGVVKIYDMVDPTVYELIGYSYVDLELNMVSGLTRGMDETPALEHIPGNTIIMDLPPVIVLNGGKGYGSTPPIITAVIPDGYPAPHEEAEFEAVMSLDSVSEIIVKNPGRGYPVTPEIEIQSSMSYTFKHTGVNTLTNTISIYAPNLNTGVLVKYISGDVKINGLKNKQWYYVGVLDQTNASFVIALYETYVDAAQDKNRISLQPESHAINAVVPPSLRLGAKAVAVTVGKPIRENNITMRFDRTSYDTQVTDWTSNAFYGSEFASFNTESASASLQLAALQPNINDVLASAEGIIFPIESVSNNREIMWSSGADLGLRVVEEIVDNSIKLYYSASVDNQYPSESTIGFTIGMPVKFTGNVGSEIIEGTTYYVSEVIDLSYFTISDTQFGSPLSLTNYTPSDTLNCITGSIIDTAVISSTYSGIRQAVQTVAATNSIKVSLTQIGTGGSDGLYTNLPVYFTGDTFGGIEENTVYYVISVIDNQSFTLSEGKDPKTLEITSSFEYALYCAAARTKVSRNDPVIFSNIVINGQNSNTFGNIQSGVVYYVLSASTVNIRISTTPGGAPLHIGSVAASDDTYCLLTNQSTVLQLQNGSGNMTLNIGAPVSPGQVNGKQFTFYPSSNQFTNVTPVIFDNMVEKTITNTIAFNTHDSNTVISGNKLVITEDNSLMYNNIPFSVSTNIGDLVSEDPITHQPKIYYADNIGNITVDVIQSDGSSVVFNGTVSGNILTVSGIVSGTGHIYLGSVVTNVHFIEGTYVTEFITGSGGIGTYRLNNSYTAGTTLHNALATTGTLLLGDGYYSDMLYAGMPIVFHPRTTFGGIVYGITYYVRAIIDSKRFSISLTEDGISLLLNVGSGSMEVVGPTAMNAYLTAGTFIVGNTYDIRTIGTTNFSLLGANTVNANALVPNTRYTIKKLGTTNWNNVANTTGVTYAVGDQIVAKFVGTGTGTAYTTQFIATDIGTGTGTATVHLINDSGNVTWEQQIVQSPVFDISYTLGGYNVLISSGGVGFTQNNSMTISGDLLGGTSPKNDLTLTVNQIDIIVPSTYNWSVPVTSNGTITNLICNGTPNGTIEDYYLKVESATSFTVYSDPFFTQPVSGIDFPYQGFTTTQVSVTNAGSEEFTVISSDGFVVGDPIVFTGNVFGNVILGQTYYIYDIPSLTSIKITESPNGISFSPTTGTGNMTITKAGSFMTLPQTTPFEASIVKYSNRLWKCVISNNDSEFTMGKWELLNSGDRILNALDRAKGYYNPTVNMPGYDLTQLFTGLTYPNTTYKGNAFETDQQYDLDTRLQDLPFAPATIQIPAIIFNGFNYVAPANLPNYAGLLADIEIKNDWLLSKMSNQTLSFTDLILVDGVYVMTSTNSATPIFKSDNYQNWSTTGYFIPYGTEPADIEFDKKRLNSAGLQLNSVAQYEGTYVAVGKNIVVSDDLVYWYERLDTSLNREFYDVSYVSTSFFEGFVAVGKNNIKAVVYSSEDGIDWTDISPINQNILYGVTSGFDYIFAVGADKTILQYDGTSWTNIIVETGLADYYDIVFADNTLVIAGENGTVLVGSSSNNISVRVTNTTENLNNITYSEFLNEWTIVGDNNTILQTNNITTLSVVWTTFELFREAQPNYSVIGDPFLSGYGPEEMVPGLVQDQLTMIVNTLDGVNIETYIQIVNENNEGITYSVSANTETYLTQAVEEFSTRIYVNDATSLVKTEVQGNTTPTDNNGYYYIALNVQKDEVISVSVYNNNVSRQGYIEQELVSFVATSLGPFVKIKKGSWIEPGDSLTITTTFGKFIYINGEYMTITGVDFSANMITVLRGQLNSSRLMYIPQDTIAYGLLSENITT